MTFIGTAMVDEPKRRAQDLGARRRKRAPAADGKAREFLRRADTVLARPIDARPDFRPRAWMDELPLPDAFGTLIFQVAGQQLSASATRTIVSRIQQHFEEHLPSPAELFAADPQVLRDSGMSARKGATLRALAERFLDGRLSDDGLARMTDAEMAELSDRWRPHRSLAVSYLFRVGTRRVRPMDSVPKGGGHA
jgi:3-methyladenine DNA glycosylase/8-oxoguanine DNA glycosylase